MLGSEIGVGFVLFLLVAIALISILELIQLYQKSKRERALNSNETDDAMSISVGLQMRQRILGLIIAYVCLRSAGIFLEIYLLSESESESELKSTDGEDVLNSWSFALTVYLRFFPVYLVLAIYLVLEYYLCQLCIVLSGRRSALPVDMVRIASVAVAVVGILGLGKTDSAMISVCVLLGEWGTGHDGAYTYFLCNCFLLFFSSLLAVGNGYIQMWLWTVLIVGLAHFVLLAGCILSLHALFATLAVELSRLHFAKCVWFVGCVSYSLLLAGAHYILDSLYYSREPLSFW